jgi:hypothetical protein
MPWTQKNRPRISAAPEENSKILVRRLVRRLVHQLVHRVENNLFQKKIYNPSRIY